MKYENKNGINEMIKRIFIMPIFSESKLIKGKINPITPQLKPPINPEIILLNSGIKRCANDILTGTARKLTNPIKINDIKDKIPCP